MKTRYTSLVGVKKNIMQRCERVLQDAYVNLENASLALDVSYKDLSAIITPSSGSMPEFLASRTLLDVQRNLIKKNEEWVLFTKQEIFDAKESLKKETLEYEKFNYLELQEIKLILQKQKFLESKELDEVALMTYDNKRHKGKAS